MTDKEQSLEEKLMPITEKVMNIFADNKLSIWEGITCLEMIKQGQLLLLKYDAEEEGVLDM